MDQMIIDGYATKMGDWEPQQVLTWALEQFESIAISFSGAEDVVLIDMAKRITDDVQVFSLDTGRLHPQTYQFLEKVREHYKFEIEMMLPEPEALEKLVRNKGLYSFYRDGHKECCAIRKVGPLRRKLADLDAWVTGQRRDQSISTRESLPVVQEDAAFSSVERPLVKFNPLANWSSAQVWQYIRDNGVPYNELHGMGFTSIGCEPCTRSVLPSQHEREGRWWWENVQDKECGLHSVNTKVASPADKVVNA